MRLTVSVFAAVAVAACHPVGGSPHGDGANPHASPQAHAQAAPQSGPNSGDVTVDIQGGYDAWRRSPFLHQYYDLTKAAFADGAEKVDFAAYQEKSYAIFRAFGAATGGGKAAEEGMLDHLKDIPRQMVGIVKEDPSVLESYDRFWVALSGPP
ncbi:MAG TPA: hypothetical protein VFV70_16495 [Hyphomonadaceae bacterium]|nr:hypothetical protein [Hyphomonadaceae bacterium]